MNSYEKAVKKIEEDKKHFSINNYTCTIPIGITKSEKYGYIYNLADISNAIVCGNNTFNLSNNGPLQGINHTPDEESIKINNWGIYQINYSINTTLGVGASIAIAVNGVVESSTNIGALVTIGNFSGTAILELKAGDVITLVNNSDIPIAQALTPNIGVQLNIVRLE